MEIIKSTNLVLRFLLELCLLAAFGYWGFQTGQVWLIKVVLGVGAPLLVAVVWGTFLAPRAAMRLREPWLLILELGLFGLAIAALYFTGHPALAWALGVVYGINRLLMYPGALPQSRLARLL
jgi:hypothetical protein